MPRRRTEPLTKRPVRFPVYLDVDTHKQLIKKAVDKGISATEAVEELIKAWVKPARKSPKG